MKSRATAAALVLAVALLGVGWLAWNQHLELIQSRADALNPDERAELRKRAWDAEARAKKLEADLAAERAKASTNAKPDDTKSGDSAAKANPAKANNARVEMLAMLNSPEMQAAMNAKFREAVDTRYAQLFKSMNLAPAALAQLKDLLVERQSSIVDIAAAAAAQSMQDGKKFDQSQMRELIATAQNDIDQKLQSQMGPEAFAQFQNYENAQLFRGATANLQRGLAMVQAPMSDEQQEQFTVNIAGLAQNTFSPDQKKAVTELTRLQQTQQTLQQVEQLAKDQMKKPTK